MHRRTFMTSVVPAAAGVGALARGSLLAGSAVEAALRVARGRQEASMPLTDTVWAWGPRMVVLLMQQDRCVHPLTLILQQPVVLM